MQTITVFGILSIISAIAFLYMHHGYAVQAISSVIMSMAVLGLAIVSAIHK